MTGATIITFDPNLIRGYIEVAGVPADGLDADWSQVTNIVGVRDFLDTDRVDGPSNTFNLRLTRCYELALHGLLEGCWPAQGFLVHGSIHGPGDDMQRIAHAWLRVRTRSGIDLVWEPITHLVHLQAEWERAARAREEYAYDKVTAAKTMLRFDHYGPWQKMRYR